MKTKELVLTFLCAFVVAWSIQHFILDRWFGTGPTVAQAVPQECKSLNKDVAFLEVSKSFQPERTVIDVPWGSVTFTTAGACVDALSFKQPTSDGHLMLNTITPVEPLAPERGNFLVALSSQTPLAYKQVSHTDGQEQVSIVYEARNDACVIQKRFTVYKNRYVIDIELAVAPKSGQTVEPRILFNAPYMTIASEKQSVQTGDTVSAVVESGGSFKKMSVTAVSTDECWQSPSLMGADSRYFVHALIKDAQQYCARGYYNVQGNGFLTVILEGKPITQDAQWALSFYCGPKEINSMAAVDTRLDQTLEYAGILAPISKLLLKLLKFLYSLIGNYGLAIILLTILVKLLLLPFTYKSEASMRQQAEVQKKLAYLQQRYKDDPEKLNQERTELIRKHGMPGLSGCLPLLLQLPLFIALSRVLYSSIELYKAPMWWIPDLSASDPYYILPVGVAIVMLLQAATVDAKQRLSVIAMALVFGALTVNFASGLALYIFVSTLLTVVQTSTLRYFNIVK